MYLVCTNWHHRGLGKTLVLNSLCASLFVYKLSVLNNIKDEHAKKYDQLVCDFLWDAGRLKIALTKLQADRHQGGLKLINIKKKDIALKCQWVSMAKDNQNIRNLALQFLPPIGMDIFLCNLNPQDVAKNVKPSFWADVVKCWFLIHHVNLDDVSKIAAQSLWYNSSIKIQKKVVYYSKVHTAGMRFLYNIWNPLQKMFLSYDNIITVYGDRSITYLQYYGLITAVPAIWVQELKKVNFILDDVMYPYENFQGKMTSAVYSKLIKNKNLLHSLCSKWEDKLQHTVFTMHF